MVREKNRYSRQIYLCEHLSEIFCMSEYIHLSHRHLQNSFSTGQIVAPVFSRRVDLREGGQLRS